MYPPLQQTIKYLPLSLPPNQISCPIPSQPCPSPPKTPYIQGKVGIKTYLMSKIRTKNQKDFVLRHWTLFVFHK